MVDTRLFQLAVEQTKDYAVFLLDPEGRVVTWNLGAERIKGYAPEQIMGRHFSVFYTPEAVASGWPTHELKAAATEGRFEDEGWRVRRDGSRFWANVIITALRAEDGALLGYSKITRDLTDRKLREEALRQSEERFRLLIEGVVDYAIYMLDLDGIVTSWNTGAERIKGYGRDEIIGKHFSRFYLPEDVNAGKPWEELALARRTGRAESEGWRLRKNGERFWARAVVSVLRDAKGRLRGFAKVTQDLTERRQVQDLEKAASNLREFIAALAHELRNPLAPIRTAVQVMAKAPPGDPAHAAMRQTIERQSAQLARIVDEMLDVTRITRGEFALERANMDVQEAVCNAIETAAPEIESRGHTLDVRLAAQPVLVSADMHRLTQLLANVLNNAARYTPAGGRIEVTVGSEKDAAVVRVRDNGRGIEPEMIEHIFDMFVQDRAPLQRVEGGLGIGLGLARRLAEIHGGTLEAHSEGVNKGSEFILRLPLIMSTRAPVDERVRDVPQSPAQAAVPRRVLVVDDNADAADALSILLDSLGHETCVVYSGADALEQAIAFQPDIVLLDIGMPGLDGYEVAKRLQALRKSRPLRIVAVTGWGQPADRQKSQEAGFDLHLVKPVGADDLARAFGERNGAPLH